MATKKSKVELKRVNMNLPAELVARVVEYGEKKGLNTTSAYIVLLNQALNQVTTLEKLPAMLELFNQVKSLQDLQNSQEQIKELLDR